MHGKILYKNMMSSLSLNKLKKRPVSSEVIDKPKKKIDRFDGISEEEVQKGTLPDILQENLDVIFVGINPSLMAAYKGRYYAGPGNHFYKLLNESGLVPRPVTFEDDEKLLDFKIGLTNIVERATKSASDLRKTEIKAGAKVIQEKLERYKPKVAVFNGKGIFEVFANKSANAEFQFGLQGERIGNTALWVVPSSSARCANFPRMTDKLHFYLALKKYLSFLKGEIKDVNYKEFCFEGKCKPAIPTTSKMWRRKEMSAFQGGGRVVNKATLDTDTMNDSVSTVIRSTEFTFNDSKPESSNDSGRPASSEVSSNEYQESESESDKENVTVTHSGSDEMEYNSLLEPSSNSERSNESINKVKEKRQGRNKSTLRFSVEIQKDDTTTIDFVSLIKQRLLMKEQSEKEVNNIENNCSESEKSPQAKRLKYSNLTTNNNRKSDFFLRECDSDSSETIYVECD